MAEFFHTILAVYKSIAFIISILSIVGIFVVVIRHKKFRASLALTEKSIEDSLVNSDMRSQKIARDGWTRITKKLEEAEKKDYKTAIIEADALVDTILKAYGYVGDTMGDRMKTITPEQVPSIKDFWRAHKVRNDIAHDPQFEVHDWVGQETMRSYKRVLEDLEAM
jgi:hypothetical protein